MASDAPSDSAAGTVAAEKEEEIEIDAPGFFRLYKNGRFVRLIGTERMSASLDPSTGVDSKDVLVDPSSGVSVRLYLPPVSPTRKLPVLVYFHGGAFCLESAASPIYHRHLNTLASRTPLLVVSVDYRLAPEHPLPTAYEDSWTALRWVFSSPFPDQWIADYGDLTRVFLAGDSAGANIAHHLALRGRKETEAGIAIKGVLLIHPYFWGTDPIGSESADPTFRSHINKIWQLTCPDTTGPDDPRLNPFTDEAKSLKELGCDRLLVTIAEKDLMRNRGRAYYDKVKESGWTGEAELHEMPDAEHVFHLFHPDTEKADEQIRLFVDFFNKE
ncbi:hypothetical protein HPP92_025457 [Vanilla planifolia]|uniref:Alpha/beta hydrolase fold-3 domain-containing protein n=1 Tax=Vanilla planifolia TaxID=51239 RepID=A0A835PK20_VANPL|nr:hypothetical protein HPP92_025457 [Vanilla planifolia]